MPENLKELRQRLQIHAKDMVAVVKEHYPKYDKMLQSKCEHVNEYGVQLTDDAMAAIRARFAPDLLKPEKRAERDQHKLPHRIYCRLSNDAYDQLQQCLKRDGRTAQAWLTEMVRQYLDNGKEQTP